MVLLVSMLLIKGTYYKLFSHAAWLIEGQAYSDGPLVPMMRLVQIENDVIPMVLLVNMHLIGDLDYFPLWPGSVQGNSVGPLVPNGSIGTNRKGCPSSGSIGEQHLIKGT